MRKIGNFLIDVVIIAWFSVAIFVTICLLSYNDFSVTVFGKNTFLKKTNVGDKVFYYNSAMNSSIFIYLGEIQDKEQITRDQSTYTIDGIKVSSDYIIGKVDNTKVIHNIGRVLGIFTSKWGFMFLVIFPTLFAIIYEIMLIVDLSKNKELENE